MHDKGLTLTGHYARQRVNINRPLYIQGHVLFGNFLHENTTGKCIKASLYIK